MASDFGQWERVASELRACRQAQRDAWGDLDNATLGRYLAGDVTPEETRRVEAALTSHPELRSLTQLVGEVLRDCEPVAASRPSVLHLRTAAPWAKTSRWRRRAAVAAAACLLAGLGYAVLPKGTMHSAPSHGDLAQTTTPKLISVAARPAPAQRDAEPPRVSATPSVDGAKRAERAPSSPVVDRLALACADGLYNAGATYQRHGDLDLAEFSYKLAYNIQEWKLGADAKPTVETRRNLGDVYQTALAMADAPGNLGAPAAVPAPAPALAGGNEAEVRNTAFQLRDRISRQAVRDVRNSVVPVLMQNLREAQTSQDREQLGRALAELGPAARDAVPVLEDALKKAQTPQERAVVLRALGELGPAAGAAAAPVIVTSLKSPSPEVRQAAEDALAQYGVAGREAMMKLADGAADHPEWRDLKERLEGVEGRVGVRDRCELFSLHALKQGQKEIRELARTRRVEIYAETRPAAEKDGADHPPEVGPQGVAVVIRPEPVGVVVSVGEALRRAGFDETQRALLRRAVEEAAGRKQFDEALLAGVRFVEQFEADRAAPPVKPE